MSSSEFPVLGSIEEFYINEEMRLPPQMLQVDAKYTVMAALRNYRGKQRAARIPVGVVRLLDTETDNLHLAELTVPNTISRKPFNTTAELNADGYWKNISEGVKFTRSFITKAYFMGGETDWDGGLQVLTTSLDAPESQTDIPQLV